MLELDNVKVEIQTLSVMISDNEWHIQGLVHKTNYENEEAWRVNSLL